LIRFAVKTDAGSLEKRKLLSKVSHPVCYRMASIMIGDNAA